MGIMNKMKTVKIRDLKWTMSPSDGRYLFVARPSGMMPQRASSIPPNAYCEGYRTVSQNVRWVNMDLSNATVAIYLVRTDITSVAAFLESEGDKLLTYETIDSVEEKIACYGRYFRLKDLSWAFEASASSGGQIHTPVIDNPQELVINSGWNPVWLNTDQYSTPRHSGDWGNKKIGVYSNNRIYMRDNTLNSRQAFIDRISELDIQIFIPYRQSTTEEII